MFTATITLFSAARLDHAATQQRLLAASTVQPDVRVLVWLDSEPPPIVAGAVVLHVPPGRFGMRLATGRNRGARAAIAAGAQLMVFLDADCVTGIQLIDRYRDEAERWPDHLLCGAVTYLDEGQRPTDAAQLATLTNPHPARPVVLEHTARAALSGELRLFWSLSFAIRAEAWARVGGFFEGYEGYGAEDTDFARAAAAAGVGLAWVGGADAYHQWHPTTTPPWQHLDDILRNSATFARRWGEWPMAGWLSAFEAAGAIEWNGQGWARTGVAEPASR